jgi:DNA-binding PadR family transcriptional regulator
MISSGADLEEEILSQMNERLLKNFMDILILARTKNNDISGYDMIQYIHDEFGFLISSGTIYSLLYSMERDGLEEGMWNGRKRVYTLTDKGKETIRAIQNASRSIQNFMAKLLQAK